eukprot:9405554-Pyramimonas_sp.AAC.1
MCARAARGGGNVGKYRCAVHHALRRHQDPLADPGAPPPKQSKQQREYIPRCLTNQNSLLDGCVRTDVKCPGGALSRTTRSTPGGLRERIDRLRAETTADEDQTRFGLHRPEQTGADLGADTWHDRRELTRTIDVDLPMWADRTAPSSTVRYLGAADALTRFCFGR